MPADEADLETHLLQFLLKNFGFERSATAGEQEVAVFGRTETESESQFRPRLVKLRVVVPRAWVLYDLAADALVLGRDGATPGPRGTGTAHEESAEKSEFREQGIDWKKVVFARGSVVYVPRELEPIILSPTARAALGLG